MPLTEIYEPISVFDIFKIGIGPSSSHTLGPWRAAQLFINEVRQVQPIEHVYSLKVYLYGSLAKTGKGHGTDIAILLGLCGEDPITMDVSTITEKIDFIFANKKILLAGRYNIPFDPVSDVVFLFGESLPYHPNGVRMAVTFNDGTFFSQNYYSIGGGFVQKEGIHTLPVNQPQLPFPISTGENLLHWCMKTGLHIHEVVLENERIWRSDVDIKSGLLNIWQVMLHSIYTGCHKQGELPGGLLVKRRAAELNKKLLQHAQYHDIPTWIEAIRSGGNSFSYTLNWVNCFALAVNEENAAFGRVVTAPTNGASGVIPAVLAYFIIFCNGNKEDAIIQFLLTAGEIGSIFKKGSTISAAMGGCQAEIGVSSAMAAAALTESMGGHQRQALMAAEIAMEHHLGLTCDPIAGLVQIPCIERNTMGAIKAITASQLALQSTPDYAKVSLDGVIKTMWETALDMNSKYKETADGGLATNIPISLSEC